MNLQKGNTQLIIIVLVLLGLFGGGYFYFQSSQSQQPATPTKIDSMADKKSIVKDDETMMEKDTAIMDRKDVMEMVLNDNSSLTGKLVDVSGGSSSGTAYLLRRNSTLYHYVEAQLPDPAPGLVYEGWLVSKTPTLKFFSTGVMNQSNTTFTLSYTTDNEYAGYNDVVITLETEVDAAPEDHILEGIVK
jgi:hypothetical protein